MAKEPNRAAEMAVFVRVVEVGDFSSAARTMRLSPSAVSKVISRLESRLGTLLLRRSTRRLALTPEGEVFHARARTILDEIEAAEREAGGAHQPAGEISISSSASYVTHVLARILPEFLQRYPEIDVDIVQTDALADLVADRTDVAIRAGPLADSSYVARALGETPLVFAAAPSWVRQHGAPATLKDLVAQDRLGFAYQRTAGAWLRPADARRERVRVSDGEGIRQLALAGVAPARLAHFTIRDDLAAGRLVQLLPEVAEDSYEAFHAVYVGRSDTLPQRVQVLLNFLSAHGTVQ